MLGKADKDKVRHKTEKGTVIMRKRLALLLTGTMLAMTVLTACGGKSNTKTDDMMTTTAADTGMKEESDAMDTTDMADGGLKGDITFWHSFTQGPRLEVIQATADQFMKDNPDVKITIETFSWGDFYTKWPL